MTSVVFQLILSSTASLLELSLEHQRYSLTGARAAEEIRGAERATAGSAQFELIFSQNGGIPGNSANVTFLGW